MLEIRPFEDKYLDNVLSLLDRSISTNRSNKTWMLNDMTAILAFDRGKLIGVIPFEKRKISFGGDKISNVLWVSAAHVESEYRSGGIGTAMDKKIKEYFYPDNKAVLVCRGDENSAAYKWYKKIGYQDLLPVISFKKEVEKPQKESRYELWQSKEDIIVYENQIYDCFIKNNVSYRGFPQRYKTFWSDKLNSHYYKEYYKYCIVALVDREHLLAYAFIGKTSFTDNIDRIDILELIMPDSIEVQDNLFNAIMQFAHQQKVKEIRLQLSSQDHHLQRINDLGFKSRWRYNIMGRMIDSIESFKGILSENKLQKDYRIIFSTPGYGENCFGEGERTIRLFMHDSIITHIIMNRCNIRNTIKEGRLVLYNGNDKDISVLEKVFPFYKWRFFHLDYI